MPGGMFGTELAKEAARLRPDLKILLTSGHTEHPVDALDGGGREVRILNKPYRRHDLAAMLRSVLKRTDRSTRSFPHRREGGSIACQERPTCKKTTTRFATNSAASMTKIRSIGPFNTGQYATPTRPPRIRTGRL